MPKYWKGFAVVTLTLMFGLFTPAVLAGSHKGSMSQQNSQQSSTRMMQGELASVNTSNQTFTVKQSNGNEVEFYYNSKTKVEGTMKGIQGLSSEKGTNVTVHYREHNNKKWATEIDVQNSNPRQ